MAEADLNHSLIDRYPPSRVVKRIDCVVRRIALSGAHLEARE